MMFDAIDSAWLANLFCLHFLSEPSLDGLPAQPLRRALAATWSLFAVALGVADLDAALGQLETRGVRAVTFHHHTNDEMALTPNNQGQRSRPAGPCQTGDESC